MAMAQQSEKLETVYTTFGFLVADPYIFPLRYPEIRQVPYVVTSIG